MRRFQALLPLLFLVTALYGVRLPTARSAILPNTGLVGLVKSGDGKPIEGVSVSAKAKGATVTTTVYTNQRGEYYFPSLPDGEYRMWAQAVGFELTRHEQSMSSGKKIQQDFTLNPLQNFERQLSDIEWFESLPNETTEDRRMKKVVLNNCGSCHDPGFVLEKRFDAAGWEMIINQMRKLSGRMDPQIGPGGDDVPGGGKNAVPMLDEDGNPIGPGRRVMEFYKNEIIEYLARVRGPQSLLTLRPLPRPVGEAANIVVTEYDLPDRRGITLGKLDPKTGHITQYTLGKDGGTTREDEPKYRDYEYANGSDWSLGIHADSEYPGSHDMQVGTDGYVYFGVSQGITKDKNGNIWAGRGGGDGSGLGGGDQIIKFDTKAGKFKEFPMPKGSGNFEAAKDVDNKGNVWASYPEGVYRLNTETGEYTKFPAKTKLGRVYGMAVDADGNAWFNQIAIDKVGYVNGRTGEVGEVVLPPLDEDVSAKDREVARGWAMNAPLYTRGPRRMGADKGGDTIWINQFFAGRLGKIDIHTKKYTDYPLPGAFRFSYPYSSVVDKNHIVWFNFANADFVGRLDPVTGKFTFFPLPTRGHNSRHIDVDNKPNIPEVWIPYSHTNKIARVQFRAG